MNLIEGSARERMRNLVRAARNGLCHIIHANDVIKKVFSVVRAAC